MYHNAKSASPAGMTMPTPIAMMRKMLSRISPCLAYSNVAAADPKIEFALAVAERSSAYI